MPRTQSVEITKDLLRTLRVDIATALREVGERHGVSIVQGNSSYDATLARTKLEIMPRSVSSVGVGKGSAKMPTDPKAALRAEAFKTNARDYGMKAAWLGKTFSCRGSFVLVGLDLNRPKNCVVGQRVGSTKCYLFTVDQIVAAFNS